MEPMIPYAKIKKEGDWKSKCEGIAMINRTAEYKRLTIPTGNKLLWSAEKFRYMLINRNHLVFRVLQSFFPLTYTIFNSIINPLPCRWYRLAGRENRLYYVYETMRLTRSSDYWSVGGSQRGLGSLGLVASSPICTYNAWMVASVTSSQWRVPRLSYTPKTISGWPDGDTVGPILCLTKQLHEF